MMTILSDIFARQSGRKYLRVCNTIKCAISDGSLQPGDQLPPQRELADVLGVTLGTITRGYQEARRHGLLVGETGRGTFVRKSEAYTLHGRHNHPVAPEKNIPFDLNFPVLVAQPDLGKTLGRLATDSRLERLLRYQKAAGLPEHRDAAIPWLDSLGVQTTWENLFITAGGQHCIHTVLLSLGVDSGPVGVETYTYPGTIHAARGLDRKLLSIPMDGYGMDPLELKTACRNHKLSAIYLMPAIQNPTATAMPLERREAIVEVAREFDLTIIEDDVYGPLQEQRIQPIQALAPERTFYCSSLSKCVSPGLRVGYLVVPEGREKAVEVAVAATLWMTPPLMAEIASRWLKSGEIGRTTAAKQQVALRRLALAKEILGHADVTSQPGGVHLWLKLPEPWRAEEFTREAERSGVAILPSIAFTARRQADVEAVRVCFGAPEQDREVRRGFEMLAELLTQSPELRAVIL